MATTIQPTKISMSAGIEPILRVAAWVSLAHAILWGGLYFRWVTFGSLGWDAFEFENALATLRPLLPYLIFGIGFVVDLSVGVLLLRKIEFGRQLGLVRGVVFVAGIFAYWFATGEFYGAVFALALAGFLLVLLTRNAAWAVNYPAAFWLIVFFVLPNVFIFVISLSERGPRGTILYPEFSAEGLRILFDDYGRFFGKIGGQYIYLRILWRSVMLATGNTILCLLLGYPFAYWIARRPEKWRNLFVFLVLIPFWTNGLVRIYAWIVMLRDSGLINTFWTSS
ncbi:MAG: ABC transporter permease, partial [Candidatus Promineifilaceae bacterium]